MKKKRAESRKQKTLLAALFSAFCFLPSAFPQTLTQRIDAITVTAPLDHAVWGIDVEDDSGAVLYARNAHVLMIPASNRKLFSTATDVSCLGLDARFTTELWRDGDDVILRGDGDPSFASARHESAGVAPFVDALRRRGVTRVHDVIADVSRFSDRITIPGGWKVGNLPADYSAPVDALAYDENVSGDQSVPDAALFAAQQLRDALLLGGVHVTGNVKLNTTARTWAAPIASIQSPTLFQLLTTTLKNSHNLYAEMLYKRSSANGSYADSEQLERTFATREVGVDENEFRFVDGSGLAPDDLVTPAALAKLVHWMNAPERRGVWWMLLPQPGGEGTLHNRLKDFSDRLVAKTGSLNGVNALSGIVRMNDGSYRYFAVVLNHHLASTRDALHAIDAIVAEVAK